jgi:hypothetical protein
MANVPSITGLSQVVADREYNNTSYSSEQYNNNNNFFGTNLDDGTNYKDWIQQVQHRLEKYRHLATTPSEHDSNNNNNKSPVNRSSANRKSQQQQQTRSIVNPSSNDNNNPNLLTTAAKQQQLQQQKEDEEKLLQMTRREIEVLAAYHCELQRMIQDQNTKIDMMYTELSDTHDLAERLQVEVQKKSGGGISPRRKAKQQLRQEIIDTRRKIDATHSQLLHLQSELEGVRAEHADVRQFITRQFFPTAKVSPEMKWPPVLSEKEHPLHMQNTFIVRPTKAVELREQIILDRRRGCVPGTNIKSTTYQIKQSDSAERRSESRREGNNNNTVVAGVSPSGEAASNNDNNKNDVSWDAYHKSAERVRMLQQLGDHYVPPQLVGHLTFTKKKVDRTAGAPHLIRKSSGTKNLSQHNETSQQREFSQQSTVNNGSPTGERGGSMASSTRNNNTQNNSNNAGSSSIGRTSNYTTTKSSSQQQQQSLKRGISPLKQERAVRPYASEAQERPAFRGTTLYSTNAVSGILRHGDPTGHTDY